MSPVAVTPTIVVGYDGSAAARAALLYAARQAGAGGRVVIVAVYEPPPERLGHPNFDRAQFRRRREAEEQLAALPLDDAALAGPDYEREVIGGAPAAVLAERARELSADELVVGARGLGRLRALLGSVSSELLRIADRPVVVIPEAVTKLESRETAVFGGEA